MMRPSACTRQNALSIHFFLFLIDRQAQKPLTPSAHGPGKMASPRAYMHALTLIYSRALYVRRRWRLVSQDLDPGVRHGSAGMRRARMQSGACMHPYKSMCRSWWILALACTVVM